MICVSSRAPWARGIAGTNGTLHNKTLRPGMGFSECSLQHCIPDFSESKMPNHPRLVSTSIPSSFCPLGSPSFISLSELSSGSWSHFFPTNRRFNTFFATAWTKRINSSMYHQISIHRNQACYLDNTPTDPLPCNISTGDNPHRIQTVIVVGGCCKQDSPGGAVTRFLMSMSFNPDRSYLELM